MGWKYKRPCKPGDLVEHWQRTILDKRRVFRERHLILSEGKVVYPSGTSKTQVFFKFQTLIVAKNSSDKEFGAKSFLVLSEESFKTSEKYSWFIWKRIRSHE